MDVTENIWKEYHSRLLAFIAKRVESKTIAEDILQDVFVKIHTHIDSVNEEEKLEAWLFSITRNTIIDHYRTRKQHDDISTWVADSEEQSDERARRELEGCLLPMIQQLPEKYRKVMELSEIQDVNLREISNLLDISISGIKSRVQRGRLMLKGLLYECCQFETDLSGKVFDYNKKNNGDETCCE